MVNTSLLYFWPVAEGWEELCERRTAMCAPCATLHGSDTSIPRLLAGFAASCDRCRAVRNSPLEAGGAFGWNHIWLTAALRGGKATGFQRWVRAEPG